MRTPRKLKWMRALAEGNYAALAAPVPPVSDPIAQYVRARALVVLGEYAQAERVLAPTHPFASFLQWQLGVYRRTDLEASARQALDFVGELPPHPVLQGDYHFVLGYLFIIHCDYRQGIRHQEKALSHYEGFGLPAPAAAALFNLCVGCNYLDAQAEVKRYFARLAALSRRVAFPSVHLHSLRFEAYFHAYRENYPRAESALKKALQIAEAAGRTRDIGGLACMTSYVLLRQNKIAEWELWHSTLIRQERPWDVLHLRALEEYRKLAVLGLPTRKDAEMCLRLWKKTIDPVNYAYLVQLLLDRVASAKSYELLARLAHRACLSSTRRQQCIALVDYRYHEILGLARSGRPRCASKLLTAYLGDAREMAARPRLTRARQLEQDLTAGTATAADFKESPVGVLDLTTLTFRLEGRAHDLRRHPQIVQLFAELIRAGGPVTPAELFQTIYGFHYHPFQNGSRLQSLVHRARVLVKAHSLIQRKAGMLQLDPRFRYTLTHLSTPKESVTRRRQRILEILRKSKSPLPISDIEKQFHYSRRTLQLDLTYLTRTRQVSASAGTCTRRYANVSKIK